MGSALIPGSLAQVAGSQGISLAESFLGVDAVLIVDMSGSMSAVDAPGGRSEGGEAAVGPCDLGGHRRGLRRDERLGPQLPGWESCASGP